MTYRIVCTYHPEIGTFRPGRGSWRVVNCWAVDQSWIGAERVVTVLDSGAEKALVMLSLKYRQRNSWCNPRSILAEWLTVAGWRT